MKFTNPDVDQTAVFPTTWTLGGLIASITTLTAMWGMYRVIVDLSLR